MTERTLIFSEPDGVPLRAVFHAPHADADARPAMVLLFGGGWRNGDLEQFRAQCEHFANRGIVAVRAEYRVKTRHGTTPFEAMADARAVVRFVRRQAGELKIDPSRVAVGGGSAGGHVAASCVFFDDAENGDIACRPDALVLFNPVLDTAETGFGHDRFSGRGREASPLHHVRAGWPPTVICHGTADAAVPIGTARAFARAMHEAGNRCDLHEFADAPHGFFNSNTLGGRYVAPTLKCVDAFLESIGFV